MLSAKKVWVIIFLNIWHRFVSEFFCGDNADANSNNITFAIKNTELYVSVVTLREKDIHNLSKLLSKGFERSVHWNEYETKTESKTTNNEYRYFLKSNFVGVSRSFVLIYLNQNNDEKKV